MLIDYPYSGVACSDICTGLRSKPHGSYVIFYNVSEPVIRIERILHGARDIGTIFSPN